MNPVKTEEQKDALRIKRNEKMRNNEEDKRDLN